MNKGIQLYKKHYYIIIVALIILNLFIIGQLLHYPFFSQIKTAILSVFFPFLISFIIVYIFHPVLYWVEIKFSIKTWVSTIILLIINAAFFIILINFILPILGEQALNIFVDSPKYFEQFEQFLIQLQGKSDFFSNPKIFERIIDLKNSITDNIGGYLIDFSINTLVFSFKSLWIIIMIPIILFIMMKDYGYLYDKLSQFLTRHRKEDWIQLLRNIDIKLGAYIRGQLIIMTYMFVGTFIPLVIAGINNAFIFSVIVAVTNIIPFVGPYLGGIPLGIYAYFQSPPLLIVVILTVLIMQQIDGNIGQPLVYGSQLKIHPLIIILVMLIGSSFAGVIGLVASVPIYIIIREIFIFFKPRLQKR